MEDKVRLTDSGDLVCDYLDGAAFLLEALAASYGEGVKVLIGEVTNSLRDAADAHRELLHAN